MPDHSIESIESAFSNASANSVDLIVNLSGGYSREALLGVKQALGAVVTYGQDAAIQFWDILDDTVDVEAAIAQYSFADHVDLNATLSLKIDAPEAIHTESMAAEFRESSAFEILPDSVTPNDPSYGSLYGLGKISAPAAWEVRTDASSVVVGVIDTGIDVDHPDLVNNLWVNEGEIWGDGIDNDGNGYVDDYNGYDFFNDRGIGPGSDSDGHGHGTHVAGTIAAEGNNGIGVSGVAWNASLMAVKIFSDAGTTNTAAIVAGIQYATMMGAQVTNNSWGGGGYSSSVLSAIQGAQTAGSIFVAAAGNDYGRNNDVSPHYPSTYSLDNILGVASTDSADNLSSFSNIGATTVDLGAPGSSIYSTYKNNGYAYLSGTSMATPHVTGAIALMRAENPSLSYDEVIDALLGSTDSLSSLAGKTATGGRLNLEAALDAVATDSGPVLSAHRIVLGEGVGTFQHSIGILDPVGTTMSVVLEPGIGSIAVLDDQPGHFEYTPGSGNYWERVDLRVTDADGRSATVSLSINQMWAGDTTLDGYDVAEAFFGAGIGETITAGGGDDFVKAGGGDDWITGGTGSDTIDGGDGFDTASYLDAAAGVTVSIVGGGNTGDVLSNIEALMGSNHADRLSGSDAAETLIGAGGNDTLIGGGGSDTLIGGEGTDYVSYEAVTDGLTISMPHQIQTGEAVGDVYIGIEGLIGGSGNDRLLTSTGTVSLFGEGGNDVLIGQSGHIFTPTGANDFLSGGSGNDTLIGLGGDDTLYGGDGNDVFYVGTGTDTVYGGSGTDTLNLGHLAGTFSIDMANGVVTGEEFGTVHFDSIESIVYEDATSGTIVAGGAAEIFVDTYDAVVDYSASGEAVTIDLRTGSGTGGHAEGDLLAGNLKIRGSVYDDTFRLTKGDQTIDGGGGADTVTLNGDLDQYSIDVDNGTYTVTDSVYGRGGANTFVNVEALAFSDQTYLLSHHVIWSGTFQDIDENLPAGAIVGTITASATTSETVTVSLFDDFGGLFHLDAATGLVTTTHPLDHETVASYDLSFSAVGDQGITDTYDVTIGISDVNEAPEMSGGTFSVLENSAIGSVIGTMQANDPDDAETLSYELIGDADGLFSIDAQTGVVSVAGAIDFEQSEGHEIVARVTDSGGLATDATITVVVGDLNDAPDVWRGDARMLSGVELSASISATDPEGADVTYSLVSDVDNGTLSVSENGAYTYSANSGFVGTDVFTVRVSDGTGGTRDVDISIEVSEEGDIVPGDGGLTPLGESSDLFRNSDQAIGYPMVAALSGNGYVVGNSKYNLGESDSYTYEYRIYSQNGEQVGNTIELGEVSRGNHGNQALSGLKNGGFVAYYQRVVDGLAGEFVAKRFTAAGVADGDPIVISDLPDGGILGTISSRSDGSFFASWKASNPSGADDAQAVFGRQVAADGSLGEIVRLDTNAANKRHAPVATELADGRLLFSWVEYDLDARTFEVVARYLNEAGTSDGSPFTIVSGYTPRGARYQDIVALDNGGYAVCWYDGGDPTGSNAWEIYAQIFDAAGEAVTDRFMVHEAIDDAESAPDIAPIPGGGFVATWTSIYADKVHARAFGSDGTPLGSEVLVSAGDVGRLAGNAGVTALENGQIVIAWRLSNLDDYYSHIHHRRYTLASDGDSALVLYGTGDADILRLNDEGGMLFGSLGDDLLIGGAGNDTLTGGAGDDILDGGSGTDSAVFSGAFADYSISLLDGTVTVADLTPDRDGTDILTNFDSLAFSDGSVGVGAGFSWSIDLVTISENDVEPQSAGNVSFRSITSETFSLSLADDFDGLFTIDPGTGAISSTRMVDYETQGFYSLTVIAQGDEGTTETQDIVVHVENVNETPEAEDSTFTVPENLAIGAVVGTVSVSDPDIGDNLTFSLTDNAGGLFRIDGNTGVVTLSNAVDYETASEHSLTFQVFDAQGLSATGNLTVQVEDTNEAPELADMSVIISAGVELAEWTLGASDDNGDALTYSLAAEASNGSVTVGEDGAVRYVPATGYVGADRFEVIVSDGNGGSTTASIDVSVTEGEASFFSGGPIQDVTGGNGTSASATVLTEIDAGKVASFWVDGVTKAVYSRLIGSDGVPTGTVNMITPSSDGKAYFGGASLDGGGAVVAWMTLDNDTSNLTVWAQKVDENGAADGAATDLFTITPPGPSNFSVVGLSGGGFLGTWFRGRGVFFREFDADLAPVGPVRYPNPDDAVSAYRFAPSAAALADGGYVLVWEHRGSDTPGVDIRAQVFGSDGEATTDEITVAAAGALNNVSPNVVALENGDLAFVWNKQGTSSGSETIWSVTMSSDGTMNGDPVAIATDNSDLNVLEFADIVALSGGQYAISWNEVIDATNNSVGHLQLIGGDGQPVGDALAMTPPDERVSNLQLAYSGISGLVVGWREYGGLRAPHIRKVEMPSTGIVEGGAADDVVFLGDGSLTARGGAGDDTIWGGAGDDSITGDQGRDRLFGGGGNDSLVADAFDAELSGGAGVDIATIDMNGGAVTASVADGTISSGDGTIVVDGVERVAFSVPGSDAGVSSEGGNASATSGETDLIVDLSTGISRRTLVQAAEDLGADILYGQGEDIQFWDIAGDVSTGLALFQELGIGGMADLNMSMSVDFQFESTVIGADDLAQGFSANSDPGIEATIPNDPYYGSLYGLGKIGAPDAWDRQTGSDDVIVAVIDSGIDVDHVDLDGNIWVNTGEIWGDGIDNDGNGYIDDYNGYDFVNNKGIGPGYSKRDDNGHGTHVAGTIAAEGNNGIGVSGVAWNASLMAVKVLDSGGSGTLDDIIEGIRYATMMGARVSNNSYGGYGDRSSTGSLSTAISQARSAGSIFVAAAGNASFDNDTYNNYYDGYFSHYPSSFTHSNVLAVASTTSGDSLSSFSNYGRYSVDLGAPGSYIYSTYRNNQYATMSGTSMATPHVTGAAALLLAEDPTLTYQEVVNAILGNVDSISSLYNKTKSGGRLNVDAALESIEPSDPIAPTLFARNLVLAGSVAAITHSLSATDNDGPVTLSATGVSPGSIQFYSGGVYIYQAGSGAYTDTFTVTAADQAGNTTSQAVTVTHTGDIGDATLTGDGSAEALFGGDGNDTISGGAGDDMLFGGDGNDMLLGGSGNDMIDGGDGVDIVSYADANSRVVVSMAGGSGAGNVFSNIEGIEGSAFDDTLSGTTGADSLYGGDGDDVLQGAAGADYLDGGDGVDLVTYYDATQGMTLSLVDDRGTGAAAGDVYVDIEGIVGSQGDDVIIGDSGANELYGDGGNDTIFGGAGGDFLSGDSGSDTIVGGSGDDTIYGGAGDDVLFAGGGTDSVNGGSGVDTLDLGYLSGAVEIDFDAGTAISAEFGTITFQNIEEIAYSVADGGSILATAESESLFQANGNIVDYTNSNAGVTIDLGTGIGAGGFADGDIFSGVSNIRGSAYDDVFIGSGEDEVFDGGAGADTLTFTGSFADYSFEVAGEGYRITDSVSGRDGVNQIESIETLIFADQSVGIDGGVLLMPQHGDIDENAAAGVAVGAVSIQNFGTESYTFSLADDVDGAFSIDGATGVITTTGSLDFEAAAQHVLTVDMTGDQGSATETTVTVTVNDVNEAPVDLAENVLSASESLAVGDSIGAISVNDPDDGDSHSFTLLDSAGGKVSLDSATGLLRVADVLDFETEPSFVVSVQATDAGGLSNSWGVTVNVGDANDTPDTPIADLLADIGENAALGTVIGTVTANDQDAGDTLSYSLTDSHGGRFAIDTETGIISLAGGLNFELTSEHTLTVRATDAAGAASTVSAVLTVSDENDAPDSAPDIGSGFEETPLTLTVADLMANDFDEDGDTFAFESVENAVGGVVGVNEDGDIVFTPGEEVIGAVSFDYLVRDANGAVGTNTVNLTLEAQSIIASGGSGDDEMRGGSAHDTLSGGAGSDILMGRRGNDVLMGGAGDDLYVYRIGDGADIMDESPGDGISAESGGFDTLRFGSGISVSNLQGYVDGQDFVLRFAGDEGAGIAAAGDELRLRNWMDPSARIEGFVFDDGSGRTLTASDMIGRIGSDGDEDVTWTEAAVSLSGRGGADRLTSGDGDDTLSGGTGNDVLIAGGGNDNLIGGGPVNLLTWSGSYDNDVYFKDDLVIAESQIDGPVDGVSVNRLTVGTGSALHRLIRPVSVTEAGVYTVSIYAMADELTGMRLELASAWGDSAFAAYGTAAFDLSAGSVVGTTSDVSGAQIEDVGNGWYRMSAQMEFEPGQSYINLNVRDGLSDIFGDSADRGLYMGGIQLELGDAAGEYVETRATAITEPDGDDRLEGGGGADKLAGGAGNDVLIGGGLENLLTWSGDFDNDIYLKDGASITADSVSGPAEGMSGDRLSSSASGFAHRIVREVRVDTSGIHTASIYARADELTHLRFELASGWNNAAFDHYGAAVFDLSDGAVESRSGGILGTSVEDAGDGWYRVSARMEFDPGNSYFNIYLHDGSSHVFNGDGDRGVYLSGAQLELGSAAGEYYETTDTALSASDDGGDHLTGGDGDDRVFAGAGADTIVGGSGRGNDIYDGGSGQDTIVYTSAEAAIDVDLEAGIARGADIDTDILSGIEHVIAGDGDDRVKGDAFANHLIGGIGDDVLIGGAGDDILVGDSTQNLMTWSDDFTNQAYAKDGAAVQAVGLAAPAYGMAVTRLVGNAGNVIHRMNRAVTVATDGVHTTSIFVRADDLSHLRFEMASGWNSGAFDHYGSVVFDASNGTVANRSGSVQSASVVDVGDGWYRVSASMEFSAGQSYINTYLHDGASHAFQGDDTAGLYISGMQFENAAAASPYNATGESWNTAAGSGNDRFNAGAGDDAIFGGAGTDTVDYGTAEAAVTVDLVSGTASGSDIGSDVLNSVENVLGGSGDDSLTGTAAINRLVGGGGADTIVAGTAGVSAGASRRENLLNWSAAFTNGLYLKDGTRVQALDTGGPVSGASVSRLTGTAGTGFHRMNRVIAVDEAGTYTTSIYARAEDLSELRFEMASGWNSGAFEHYGIADFDLSSGTVRGSGHDIAGASVENVGGGWYRVSATMEHSAGSSYLNIYLMDNGTHYFGIDGTGSLLLSGAQFERGTVAGTYVENEQTVTRQVAAGDTLIGGGQENIITWSESFDHAAYYKDGISVEADVVAGPQAGMTADRLTGDGSSNQHRLVRTISVAADGTYVTSVYAKAGEIDHLRFEMASGWESGNFTHYGTAVFDLTEGRVDQTSHGLLGAEIEDAGDGWYRLSARMDHAAGESYLNVYLHNGSSHAYTGDGTGSVLLSGAQMEQGGIASDYVATGASAVQSSDSGDTLVAGAGDDALSGGAGDDQYEIGREGGANTIHESSGDDTLMFDSSVAHDQLWFERTGDDLRISIIGDQGSATISDWYATSNAQVETIQSGDGRELSASNVQQLVQAMAVQQRPGDSDLTLPQETEDALDSVLASAWTSASG